MAVGTQLGSARQKDYVDIHKDVEERVRKLKISRGGLGVRQSATTEKPNPIAEWLCYRSEVPPNQFVVSRWAQVLIDAEEKVRGNSNFHTAVRTARELSGVIPKTVDWDIVVSSLASPQLSSLSPNGAVIKESFSYGGGPPELKWYIAQNGAWLYPIFNPGIPPYAPQTWNGSMSAFTGKNMYGDSSIKPVGVGYNLHPMGEGFTSEATEYMYDGSQLNWYGLRKGQEFPTLMPQNQLGLGQRSYGEVAPVDLFYWGKQRESGWAYGRSDTSYYHNELDHVNPDGTTVYRQVFDTFIPGYAANILGQPKVQVEAYGISDPNPIRAVLSKTLVEDYWGHGGPEFPSTPPTYYGDNLIFPAAAGWLPSSALRSPYPPMPYAMAQALGFNMALSRRLIQPRVANPIVWDIPQYADVKDKCVAVVMDSLSQLRAWVLSLIGDYEAPDYNHNWKGVTETRTQGYGIVTRYGWCQYKGKFQSGGWSISLPSGIIPASFLGSPSWILPARKPTGNMPGGSSSDGGPSWVPVKGAGRLRYSAPTYYIELSTLDPVSNTWGSPAHNEEFDLSSISFPLEDGAPRA